MVMIDLQSQNLLAFSVEVHHAITSKKSQWLLDSDDKNSLGFHGT